MNNEKQIVLLVDDNMANLTSGKNILKDKYNVYPIPSGEKLFEILEKITPDLVLLDVLMPEMDGYEVIKRLKASPKNQDIPVIFLTSKDDPENELEGLSLGAIDYISKPFSPALLLQRIENHLLLSARKQKLDSRNEQPVKAAKDQPNEIENFQYGVMNILAEILESRGVESSGHMERTQGFYRIMLEKIIEEKLYDEITSTWNPDIVVSSSRFHNIGKIMIPDRILLKPGKLDPDEYEIMKKHTEYGCRIIEKIAKTSRKSVFSEHAGIIAGTHHEWWNGKGYPNGLAGTDIPLQARIMAIVDVYDVLTVSQVLVTTPISHSEAEKTIVESGGTKFDPQLVEIFKKVSGKLAGV